MRTGGCECEGEDVRVWGVDGGVHWGVNGGGELTQPELGLVDREELEWQV